jgi:predicted pyridoxine 5'-phosphate oxidase superfamily flavin-nucleotide-binding protein
MGSRVVGVRANPYIDSTPRIVSPRIPPGALDFVALQRMVVLGSIDLQGRPWASMLLGSRAFATAADPTTLAIDLDKAAYHPDDPLWRNLTGDPTIGSLFIELDTRRRLRVNGTAEVSPGRLRIAVNEAYPNCPKYVQRRHAKAGDSPPWTNPPPARSGTTLDARQRRWVESADTFFVASAHPQLGADVSHRGGHPGFVQVLDPRTLRIPDYPGNSMYNPLGNFLTHPMAGLLFVDFERSTTLQLSGRVEIHWDLKRPADESGGTRRYWSLTIEEWIESELPPVLAWELLDSSRFNP